MPKTKTIQRQSIGQLRALVASRKQGFVASKREQNNLSEIAKSSGVLIATVKDPDWDGYDVLVRYRSKCHKAPVYSVSISNYACQKCKKICDIL